MLSSHLIFTTTAELVRVPADRIVYISADGNYSTITTADGSRHTMTIQLGQMEKRIAEMVAGGDNRFIRIGKSLIVNRDYITLIVPSRQKMILSDCRLFRHELTASREALKALKEYIETEVKL